MTAETIAKALGGWKTGGGWTARCPAHDDRTPSLSIRDADNKVLVRCHAGCDEAGETAARDCVLRWKRQGRRVRIARPPQGMDFNDMLSGRAPRTEEAGAR